MMTLRKVGRLLAGAELALYLVTVAAILEARELLDGVRNLGTAGFWSQEADIKWARGVV